MDTASRKTDRPIWPATTALTGLAALIPNLAVAQVALDGTTGPGGELDGPDYQITDDLGTRAGDNLFHSFEEFSLSRSQSATFSGPDEIENVVSRVTGDDPSNINGTLRSTIPDADFYFINPNGVTFGPDATLDVQGSFHVSTADELRFGDGQSFSATSPDASGLSVAEPRAFGFFDAEPGAILVDRSTLEVGEGAMLSLVGGDITIDGGVNGALAGGNDGLLRAEGGTIDLSALGGEGEVEIATSDIVDGSGGEIALIGQAHIDTSGDGGGLIRIRSSLLDARGGSSLTTNNLGTTDSVGGIVIDTGVARLDDATIESRTDVGAFTGDGVRDAGDAGDIVINAQDVIGDTSVIRTNTGSETNANGGDIIVDADTITLSQSDISTDTGFLSTGNAGNILMRAETMRLSGGEIESSLTSSGDAGQIFIDVSDVFTIDGGLIESNSPAPSGPINASGRGGDVTVRASSLILQNGGGITSKAGGAGGAGDINLVADYLLLDGENQGAAIRSEGQVRTAGRVGDIIIEADILEMRGGDDELISDPRFSFGGTLITTSVGVASNSDGGNVMIKAALLDVDNGLIASDAIESREGTAGGITIEADRIEFNDSGIRTEADTNQGGRINITAQDYAVFANSDIISNGAEPLAGASIIDIQGGVIALNNSRVFSLTGDGAPLTGSGVIGVDSDATLISVDSVVDASSSIEIGGLLTDFSNQLIVLDSQFADASRLLRENCEGGGDLGGNSFVSRGASPTMVPGDGLIPGFYADAFVTESREETDEPVLLNAPCP